MINCGIFVNVTFKAFQMLYIKCNNDVMKLFLSRNKNLNSMLH